MYKLWGYLMLLKLWEVSVNSSNQFVITCSPTQVGRIQDKYINELRDQANRISKMDYILSKGHNKIRSKLHKLERKVSGIQFYERSEIDISKCFNIDWVYKQAENDLKKFNRLVNDGLTDSMVYVKRIISLIRNCGRSEKTCAGISMCCDKAVENFDVIAFEDSIQQLDELGEQTLAPTVQLINQEIEDIYMTTKSCILGYVYAKDEEEERLVVGKYGPVVKKCYYKI